MAEAELHQGDECVLDYTADAAISGGEVLQLRDGRAGVIPYDVANGEKGGAQTEGIYRVTKTAGVVILDGGRVYWDHSANAATYKTANDRDFYLGTAVGDAASADTEMYVNLNVKPVYLLDALTSPAQLPAEPLRVVARKNGLYPRLSAGRQCCFWPVAMCLLCIYQIDQSHSLAQASSAVDRP
jgi:predicted RecA/RadA family phage recombinase